MKICFKIKENSFLLDGFRENVFKDFHHFYQQRLQSSAAVETTRRSPFARPNSRNRERTPSRFRPRPSQDNIDVSTKSEDTISAAERNHARFRTRPAPEIRFRLNPVAVTTAASETRPVRPRPDRVNTRPKLQINFRNRDDTTTEIVEEITEQVIVDDAALNESGTTPIDLLSAGNSHGISTSTISVTQTTTATSTGDQQFVDHRILDSVSTNEETTERFVLSESPSTSTQSSFRFEDFFTPSTGAANFRKEILTTPIAATITTTGAKTVPRATTTTTTARTVTWRPDSTTRAPVNPEKPIIISSPSRSGSRLTPSTPATTPHPSSPPRSGGRPPKARSSTSRPQSQIADYVYDYFYEDDTGALGGTLGELAELTEKALLLPSGKVKCNDTGYFAHPDSCKKFISCSKTVRGAVRGWVYTCPQQLVFDPVGGMCNWAEAVDCKAPIV